MSLPFSELPLGTCFKRGRSTVYKTGAVTCSKVGGGETRIKPTARVTIAPCNARPLMELGSTRRPS